MRCSSKRNLLTPTPIRLTRRLTRIQIRIRVRVQVQVQVRIRILGMEIDVEELGDPIRDRG